MKVVKCSELYKRGDFEVCYVVVNADGTMEITIFRKKWSRAYKFVVKNLNQPDEVILLDEEVNEKEVMQ